MSFDVRSSLVRGSPRAIGMAERFETVLLYTKRCMYARMQVLFEWNLCGGMVIVSDGGNDNASSFKVGDCILVSDYATFE